MIDRKKVREITGYTRQQQTTNPDAWFGLAGSFHAAAAILHESSERIPSDSRPFVLNAGYSIELVLKAILARKNIVIPDGPGGHDLCALCTLANVTLSDKQKITLELLAETTIWAAFGRRDTQLQRTTDDGTTTMTTFLRSTLFETALGMYTVWLLMLRHFQAGKTT